MLSMWPRSTHSTPYRNMTYLSAFAPKFIYFLPPNGILQPWTVYLTSSWKVAVDASLMFCKNKPKPKWAKKLIAAADYNRALSVTSRDVTTRRTWRADASRRASLTSSHIRCVSLASGKALCNNSQIYDRSRLFVFRLICVWSCHCF